MTRNALTVALASMALALSVSPATALTYAPAFGLTQSGLHAQYSDGVQFTTANGFRATSIRQISLFAGNRSLGAGQNPSLDPTLLVPEPAAWAFLLVGLGVVGAARRLRRRSASAGVETRRPAPRA